MDAYREMRFYASTDMDIQVNFTVNGFPMGQRINTKTSADIKVSITDPEAGDKIATIQLMYGEPGSKQVSTVLKKVTNSNSLTLKHDLPKGKEYYYYLEITQQDGDKVYTSPVWVHRVGN
jgi:trimeric autotransporter adhesin